MSNRPKSTFSLIAIFFLFCITASGCVSYGNRSHSLITPEVRSSTADQDKVKITISSNAWNGNPENLPKYLTPFFIDIENNTGSPITIQYDDIVLIDQFRNQYNALLPDIASNIAMEKSRRKWYFRPSISIGFGSGGYYGGRYGIGYGGYGYGYPYYRSPFYWPYNYAYYNDYYSSYYDQDYSDLFTKALIPGIIRPGARLSGFVFFKKLPPDVKTFDLNLGYRIQGEEKRYDLNFPYSVLNINN